MMKQPQYGGCKILDNYTAIALFQHIRRYHNMDAKKVSNLFKYLKDKYGEESVRLLRFWEFAVKKMADHGNHRRFTLRCIKVRVTLVSCRIRNPLHVKTNKSYQIIQKVERQLLYERVRNVNSILHMYKQNRAKYYLQLRNLILEEDIFNCISFINKIKEHRHNKIKNKQIDKFEFLA